MNKCIIFSRVSTDKQDVEQQTKVLIAEAVKRGYSEENHIIIQQHESGVKLSVEQREGVQQLYKAVNEDKDIKCVFIWEISRLARRQAVIINIRDFLIEHKVQLISMNPAFELIDENGNMSQAASLILSIFGTFAESEAKMLKERTKRGREARVKEGKYDGGHILYGYSIDEDGFFHIKQDEAAVVQRIFDMCTVQKLSGYQIGYQMLIENVFTNVSNRHNAVTYVNRMLANKSYIGKGRLGYPAIITEEQFNQARENANNRKTREKTSSKNVFICRNILHDKISGITLSPVKKENAYIFGRTGYTTCTLNMKMIDEFIWNYVYKRAKKKIDLSGLMQANNAKMHNIIDMKRKVDTKQQKLVSLLIDEKISQQIYDNKLVDINTERKKLDEELMKYKKEYNRLIQLEVQIKRNENYDDNSYSEEQKHTIVKEIINKVFVTTTGWRKHTLEILLNTGKTDTVDIDF